MKTKALYAGSFDPLTLGHLDIIERAANIFDEVVVGVVVNLEKHSMFTFEERMEMIRESTAHLSNVSVSQCRGLLADYVNNNGFNVVVRGLRCVSDFDSELQMAHLHEHLYHDKVETVFLMADAKYSFVSSTMAKQVISLGGNGEALVPANVLKRMKGKAY
ncbi:MAG: pantetheine-phosphate adenylyltransferase [Firmicutes bacterium]|nr:pantetheine-phosphate adenylyltransferase [Bacillota bacterium]